VDFAVVDLALGVLDLAVAGEAVLAPLPRDDLAGWEDEGALAVELVAETVADVLVAVEEPEVALDLDAVLVEASGWGRSYLKVTPLW
jgi:hypothetical protein